MNIINRYKKLSIWNQINLWGAIAGIVALVIYFFPSNKENTFTLTNCTFDVVFEATADDIKYIQRYQGNSGLLSAIIDISPIPISHSVDQSARLHLSGEWHGSTGLRTRLEDDSTTFNLSQKRFYLFRKKPFIEYAAKEMRWLYISKRYHIEVKPIPGFASGLTLKEFNIRTEDGLVFPISGFTNKKGWYSAEFILRI